MKCYYHPESDSAKACSSCRKLLCSSCSHTIKGTIYCQDCLVAGAELAALAASPRLANYSPARAGLFGVVPGLGAVYNGQYVKAVIHFSVFASLVILGGEIGIFVVGAISFYIFMLVDAYRSAQVIVRRWVAHPEIMEEGVRGDQSAPVGRYPHPHGVHLLSRQPRCFRSRGDRRRHLALGFCCGWNLSRFGPLPGR